MTIDLRLGDCLEVMRTLPDGCVDAVVTDPPYGTDSPRDGYGRRQLGSRHISGDADLETLSRTLPLLPRLLSSRNAWVLLCCSPKRRGDVETLCRANLLQPFGEVVWDKKSPGLGGGIRYQHESVLLCSFGKPKGRCALLSVHREWVPNVPRKAHPHEKPIGLMRKLISYASSPGTTILDPYMGSGTTGVAAVQLGFRFVGIECDPTHFATAERRIAAARAEAVPA